jgi:hypothetical protein
MVQAVVSFKSGGVAFILAFFFGLVFFNGVGHMFIGKVRRGVGIMILGWFINSLAFVFLLNSFISLPFMQYYNSYNSNNQYNFNNDPFSPKATMIIMILLSLSHTLPFSVWFIFFIF